MASPPDTAPVRMSDGFRERGAQVTRLEAFVDAAFAFSLTFLVISGNDIPKSIAAMVLALKGVPAFAACFLQIALFWHSHVKWSRRYGIDDRRSTVLSLLLVFLVLIYMYPLRLMFGTFFAWITRGWLPWPVEKLSSFSELSNMFMVYALAFGTMSLVMASLFSYALGQRAALGLSAHEAAQTAGDIASWRMSAAVSALSFAIAAFYPNNTPGWTLGLPGMVYFLMSFVSLFQRRVVARSHARFVAEGLR